MTIDEFRRLAANGAQLKGRGTLDGRLVIVPSITFFVTDENNVKLPVSAESGKWLIEQKYVSLDHAIDMNGVRTLYYALTNAGIEWVCEID